MKTGEVSWLRRRERERGKQEKVQEKRAEEDVSETQRERERLLSVVMVPRGVRVLLHRAQKTNHHKPQPTFHNFLVVAKRRKRSTHSAVHQIHTLCVCVRTPEVAQRRGGGRESGGEVNQGRGYMHRERIREHTASQGKRDSLNAQCAQDLPARRNPTLGLQPWHPPRKKWWWKRT
jgi:hypothetical protein